MRRNRILIALLVVVLLGVAYWFLRSPTPRAREQAYIFERKATAWNRLATVREPVALLRHGDRIGVLETKPWAGADYTLVLLPGGATGWVDARQLMSAEIWQRAQRNLDKSKSMPQQAAGRTKVLTNLRVDAGRAAPRSIQLGRDVSVEILSRAVVELPPEQSSAAKNTEEQAAEQSAGPRHEDWLFVHCHDEDAGELAGWVLGRFIEFDLPAPLRDYAEGQRFIAWFVLNRVPASSKEPSAEMEKGESESAKEAPTLGQYLATAVTGGEGQPCDFTRLRFYTWNAARRRYETAYVESDLCGRLPLLVIPIPAGANPEKSEASFSFTAVGKSGEEKREYRMKQNVIRRLRVKK